MFKKTITILIHAILIWGICGGIIYIGRSLTTQDNTLIIHATLVPVVCALVTWFYTTRFNYTSPLMTALVFMDVAIFLDAAVIAPFAEKSYVMFTSVLGTWIPFGLIFLSTFLVGVLIKRRV